MGHQPDPGPAATRGPIDEATRRFEAARQCGATPQVEDYLGLVPPSAAPALLRELLRIDGMYTGRDRPTITLPTMAASPGGGTGTRDHAGPPPHAPPPPELEGYKLAHVLGEGGMGVVWRAIQQSTQRPVALKMMTAAAFGSDRARSRFEREVELTARLEHPHIARVYDGGVLGGVPFYAMELIDGGVPLDRYVRAHELDQTQTLELMRPVCAAVQYAHQRGVIHRDLKPSNILVAPEGRPYVLDFGLAKSAEAGRADQAAGGHIVSLVGEVAGTPAYMSPEQAAGSAEHVDTRADVYSLGVILYRLLTGQSPHDLSGPLVEVLRRIGSSDVRKPHAVRPGFDRDLEAVLLKALARRPEDRYPTVSELLADIDRYRRGDPVVARAPTPLYLLAKHVRKHWLPLALATAAALVSFAAALLHTDRIRRERNTALTASHASEVARAAESRQRRLAELRQAQSLASEGNALGATGRWVDAERRYLTAEQLLRTLGAPTIRVEAGRWDVYRHNPPPVARFESQAGWPVAAFSPDGRSFATAEGDRAMAIRDLATGRQIRTFPAAPPTTVLALAFTPDGRHLLTGEKDGRIRLWNATTGELIRPLSGHRGEVHSLAVSRDGLTAVSASWDGTARVWNLPSGRAVATLTGHTAPLWGIAISPDGTTAASASQDTTVRIWDLVTHRERLRLSGPGPMYEVALTPDGEHVLAGGPTNLTVWDLHSGGVVRTLEGHTSTVRTLAITAAGDRVITGSSDNTVRVWNLASGRLLRIISEPRSITNVAVSPDGRMILCGTLDTSLSLHTLDASQDAPTLRGHLATVSAVAISPDLRVVASGDEAGAVRLWDVATGRQLRSFKTGGWLRTLQFSPDGAALLTGGLSLKIWNLSAGRRPRTVDAASIYRAAFSPDGTRVISASFDSTVQISDANTGQPLLTLPGPKEPALAASFTRDGSQAFAGYRDGTLVLADAVTGTLLKQLRQDRFMYCAVLAPDGRTVLSHCFPEPGIGVWDLVSRTRSNALVGHTNIVHTAVFAADSQHALTGCWDHTLRLWDVNDAAELYCFEGHTEFVLSVAASPDLRLCASGGVDREVRLWELSRPAHSRALQAAAVNARDTLASRPDDRAALVALGQWYAFRNLNDWAVAILEQARDAGADVSAASLARCYWKLGCPAQAMREFARALADATDPHEKRYLELCLDALEAERP